MEFKGIAIVTGTGVVDGEDGVFEACQSRVHQCGYACCQFGVIGNWISLLPNEREQAEKAGLKMDHLTSVSKGEGMDAVNCTRPCVTGEFKPLDCQIYPLWPSNLDATEFIVASHSKCPIPYEELIPLAVKVGKMIRDWDLHNPGTLQVCVDSAPGFVAYERFPYRVHLSGEVESI